MRACVTDFGCGAALGGDADALAAAAEDEAAGDCDRSITCGRSSSESDDRPV